MKYHILSIFPEIFTNFQQTSLIGKACASGKISICTYNIRDYSQYPHKQVDDEPYGGGHGLLMMAEPIIGAIQDVIKQFGKNTNFLIVFPGPTTSRFVQEMAHERANTYSEIIFVCGRYEGIDARVYAWCEKEYSGKRTHCSIGAYVTLGGEVPVMAMIESVSRLIPGVIKDPDSWKHESYRPEKGGKNIEHPQYTRPEEIYGMKVPQVLLSGHHAKIQERKEDNEL